MLKKTVLAVTALATVAIAAHAALPEAFHNVPMSTVRDELENFRSRGVGPRSISGYSVNNEIYGMGIFDRESAGNVAKVYVSTQYWSETLRKMAEQGYQPREFSVTMHHGRLLNYSGIFWKPTLPAYADDWMKDHELDATWQEYVGRRGYRISNYVTFSNKAETPSRRHAAVFVKDGKPFYFFNGMTNVQFAAKNKELAARGFYPDDLHIDRTDEGEVYSAIYLKPAGGLQWYYNMVASEYQATFNEMGRKGYRLKKVHAYRNGERFAAIWVK